MLEPEEIERLDKLLEQLKEWTEEIYELLSDKQKERLAAPWGEAYNEEEE